MTALETINYDVSDRVARITLDRPECGNALTSAVIAELEQCVERADLDPAVHVLLLAGNGKGFCSGYDLLASEELGMAFASPAAPIWRCARTSS